MFTPKPCRTILDTRVLTAWGLRRRHACPGWLKQPAFLRCSRCPWKRHGGRSVAAAAGALWNRVPGRGGEHPHCQPGCRERPRAFLRADGGPQEPRPKVEGSPRRRLPLSGRGPSGHDGPAHRPPWRSGHGCVQPEQGTDNLDHRLRRSPFLSWRRSSLSGDDHVPGHHRAQTDRGRAA